MITLTVLAADRAKEQGLARELSAAASLLSDVRVTEGGSGKLGEVIFVDGTEQGAERILDSLDRRGRAVFLIVEEGSEELPEALAEGRVDDILIRPFRPLEVLSRVQHFQQILRWDEVKRLNASFGEILEKMRDDVRLAESLQKLKLPARFPEVRGFRVASRYLAGLRPGGDHFDLADARDGSQLSVVLTDSSSYGLSSAVLSAMVRVAVKLTAEQSRSSRDTVERIHQELVATLGERDRLSMFYGVISRKDYRMRYLNVGTSLAFYAAPGESFLELPTQGAALMRDTGLKLTGEEAELQLDPEGRLALISDGFVEAAGGARELCAMLDRFRGKEPADTLNELAYRVKSALTEENDLPSQDCTAILLDLDSRVIRLARKRSDS